MPKLSPGDKEKQVVRIINYLLIDRLNVRQITIKERISVGTVYRVIRGQQLHELIATARKTRVKDYREKIEMALKLVAQAAKTPVASNKQ